MLIWSLEAPRKPNRLFELIWWKQASFWAILALVHLTMLGLGYCIDWAVYGEPEDDLDDDLDDGHDKSD